LARTTTLDASGHDAIEYNVAAEIAEWDGHRVWIMQKDPAYLTAEGWEHFVPRQQALYVIE